MLLCCHAEIFYDYCQSDVRTVPPEYQGFYSEKLALVPWTYLVNDHKQSRREVFAEELGGGVSRSEGAGGAPTRESLGFAEDDIILASFNQLYKIEPRVFAAWLEILRKQPLYDYMCPHTTAYIASAYYCICVLILLHI
jgi:predicted O-linked N-acetylglucosamine transferase (SPINDLY family)